MRASCSTAAKATAAAKLGLVRARCRRLCQIQGDGPKAYVSQKAGHHSKRRSTHTVVGYVGRNSSDKACLSDLSPVTHLVATAAKATTLARATAVPIAASSRQVARGRGVREKRQVQQ
jgi:hypothetical protein